MEEVQIRDLSVISNKKGDILKGFLKSDNLPFDVQEVYFSEINPNEIKAWKMHKSMTCNLIVVHGEIKIVIQKKENDFIEEIVSKENHKMITIPPNYWFGFQCVSKETSLLANITNYEHSDFESEQINLDKIIFDWG
ncbi:MAG: hypothetical protein CL769_01765 [Chloroflexi bacterium]|nr:hypothetical protein [Chloroflexota bacterium]